MLRGCWGLLIVACCSGPVAAAGAAARITLLDGPATLFVQARALRAAVGVVLPDGTLVDTQASCALLRIEWPDGSTLDLGPDSHAMLAPPPPGGDGPAPAFYLLQGWAKYSSPQARRGWYSPRLDGAPTRGVAVIWGAADRARLFAESGEQLLIDRATGRRRTLAEGHVFSAESGRPAEVLPQPSTAWLAQLPRAFRDTLPHRLAQFAGAEVVAQPADASGYPALERWLTAEPAVRRAFPERFAARLGERDFRTALAANLSRHPEWAPRLAPWSPNPAGASR